MSNKGDKDMQAATLERSVPVTVVEEVSKKGRKEARRAARRAKESIHAVVAKKNITSTSQIEEDARDKLIKLQQATGITEEMRVKLNAAEGLRIGYAAHNRPLAQNLVQVPIEYYKNRGWITLRQYDAGEAFYKLWYYGAIRSGFAVSRDPRLPRGKPNTDGNEVVRSKYEEAKAAIRGLPQKLVCYNVCCIGEWASKLWPRKVVYEANMGIAEGDDLRPLYSGREQKMEWLKEALDDLARHFKIPVKDGNG